MSRYSATEIEEMTRWVVKHLGPDVPMHFNAFHPDWKMLDVPSTPFDTLTRSRKIALANGVRYAYTGNVHDFRGSSTYCHGCGEVLVGRDWYELSNWNLEMDGRSAKCASCGTSIAGVFEATPGSWGSRRRPIHIDA